ncbi:uncharacterized protein LOC111518417 [Drosophila willistoni]|uniref:uncharacterized protein LOC111518417 n=1 Tax=Drosophila willistoni TaxID=7260 RepID=UPI001F08304E|nr:uncharacterized protein LOC111518417 [Drosophila willistoni]
MMEIAFLLLATPDQRVLADLVNVTMVHNIMGIYTGIETTKFHRNSTTSDGEHHLLMYITGHQTWIIVILGLWIITMCFFICTCLFCKCEKRETLTTTYTTDPTNLDLQEIHVHVLDPKHINDCGCVCCLHRQLAKELQMKNQTERLVN